LEVGGGPRTKRGRGKGSSPLLVKDEKTYGKVGGKRRWEGGAHGKKGGFDRPAE